MGESEAQPEKEAGTQQPRFPLFTLNAEKEQRQRQQVRDGPRRQGQGHSWEAHSDLRKEGDSPISSRRHGCEMSPSWFAFLYVWAVAVSQVTPSEEHEVLWT